MIKKIIVAFAVIAVVGLVYSIYVDNRLERALEKYDAQLNLDEKQETLDSIETMRELLLVGRKAIRGSSSHFQASRTYSEISNRAKELQDELRERAGDEGSLYGHEVSEILHEITVGRCVLLALAMDQFEELRTDLELERTLASDFSCEEAAEKGRLDKKYERQEKIDEMGKAHFARRCEQGDLAACEAVKNW